MNSQRWIVIIVLGLANLLVCGGGAIILFINLRPQSSTNVAVGQATATDLATPTAARTPTSPANTPSPVATTKPTTAGTSNKTPATRTPTPGGPSVSIQSIDLWANDLVFDPSRNVVYASVPGKGGPNGNSITAIDVSTQKIGNSILVGSEPNLLALSDDQQFLYVGLNGSASVRRVDLKTGKAALEFPLGSDWCGPLHVGDMAVMPGNPHTVAISKSNDKCSPRFAGVAIYDDGVARAKTTTGHSGSTVIQFASPSTLYGYDNEISDFVLQTMTVSPEGVVISSSKQNLFSEFFHHIRMEGGLLYSTSGQVVDPKQMKLVGTFPVGGYLVDLKYMSRTSSVPTGGLIVPDSKAGRVYFLTLPNAWDAMQFKVFDLRTYVQLASLDLEEIQGFPLGLVKIGTDQFAFATTEGKVYFIRLTAGKA